VDPMMVRSIKPIGEMLLVGGVMMLDEYEVEDVGLAETRNEWDEDVVDCSHRIFEITNILIGLTQKANFIVLPSRRWRNYREGDLITLPNTKKEISLLYLGNPVRIFVDPREGITVVRIPEFRIKSGIELGY
jgi:hypothetical protein